MFNNQLQLLNKYIAVCLLMMSGPVVYAENSRSIEMITSADLLQISYEAREQNI